MLLFMIQAQFEQSQKVAREFPSEEFFHRIIHMGSIEANPIKGWTRECAANRPMRVAAELLVIRVEEEAELGIESGVIGHVGPENERLEEPRGMREVPLCRTRLRHGLHHLIFRRERLDKLQCLIAYFTVSIDPFAR